MSITLTIIFYGCETWSLTLRADGWRLRAGYTENTRNYNRMEQTVKRVPQFVFVYLKLDKK